VRTPILAIGSGAAFVSAARSKGFLVFERAAHLMALAFDAASFQVVKEPAARPPAL
jgi:hypothetical protein